MSNVTTMFNNTSHINALRANGYGDAGFGIHTTPLYYNAESTEGITTNGWRSSKYATYRTDTGEELGIHGESYRAVRPARMIDTCRNILERSDFNLKGITERIDTSHNGSRTFVKYTLPEMNFKTPDGDNASLSLLAITSFDSTWPFMISAAATQYACTNLQVFTTGEVAVYKSRHTVGLDLNVGSRIVGNALDIFQNERELWANWYNKKCSDTEAFIHFTKALKSETAYDIFTNTDSTVSQTLEDMPRTNNSLNYLWDAWIRYSFRLGKNYWSLYNAFTDWSSHAPVSTRSEINKASVQTRRQKVIRDHVISDPMFKRAA